MIDGTGWCDGDGKISNEEDDDFKFIRDAGLLHGQGEAGLPVRPKMDASSGGIERSISKVGQKWTADPDPTPGLKNDVYRKSAFGVTRIVDFRIAHDASWVDVRAVSGVSDISRIVITDLDGIDAPISNLPITLKRGAVVRIHWGRGTSEVDGVGDLNGNGTRDIWIDQDAPTRSGDEIVLAYRGRYVDAEAFAPEESATLPYAEIKDLARLAELGLWRGRITGRNVYGLKSSQTNG